MIQVINCDCLELAKYTTEKAQLIFADPPFGIGENYNGFRDVIPNYEKFTTNWLKSISSLLSENGVLVVHGNDKVAEAVLLCYKNLGLKKVGWTIWHYRFGQCRKTHWVNSHAHNLIFQLKTATKLTFNFDDVAEQSDRVKYKDKRVANGVNGKRPPLTVWEFPRITGNAKERRKSHPNQLPEKMVARFVKAYTKEGDLVIDPFCGSCTTGVVCQTLGRKCITCDISKENCDSAEERLKIGSVSI